MDNWDEIRTAYQVARHGTVSGAADVLGVHHATVIRHIDALETRLGVKLFQRHARGYTPTEAGQDMMRVGQATDDQFGQLEGRIKGRGNDVSGELVVTSLANMSRLVTPVLAEFQAMHPGLMVRYLTDDRVFRLEYGEAHVAIRAGSTPQEPDNVVQPLVQMEVGLFATKDYVAQNGKPESLEDFTKHRFVGNDNEKSRAPFLQWLSNVVPRENITFRATDANAMEQAVLSGAGIGFLPRWYQHNYSELEEVWPADPVWHGAVWLVTHVDLHRTVKVQSFLTYLKQRSKDWKCYGEDCG
ncbi:LysR family transcriptional regulator [Cognatishimia maritima]|uniref:Transcriptional regulator, LysR family n=1 Tax=Cognatishimia maritima TaxID=870908 RepID=A0A1M5NEB7_9RHOB|nr:LysR family transcriptional regulator [Cognatishimia maritima]SHG87956.1 transcriptional regulator, LysR family [Cognatishimia maritima]